MMMPSSFSGAKMAERAPMTIRDLPLRMRCHSSKRSPCERCEWRTATWSWSEAKRDLKRWTVWGVREISGTRMSAVFPWSRWAWTAWR